MSKACGSSSAAARTLTATHKVQVWHFSAWCKGHWTMTYTARYFYQFGHSNHNSRLLTVLKQQVAPAYSATALCWSTSCAQLQLPSKALTWAKANYSKM